MSGVRLTEPQQRLLRLMGQHDFATPFVLTARQYPSAFVMFEKGLAAMPDCKGNGQTWMFVVSHITPAGRAWLERNKA